MTGDQTQPPRSKSSLRLAITGRTPDRLEGDFHGELQNPRVTRAVVLAEERAQRAGRICDTLAANVVADDHFIVAGENGVAGEELLISGRVGSIRHNHVSACVNARELCVVEHIESFQTKLD